MTRRLKITITLIVILAACVLLWFSYAPEHWLRHVRSFATVTVDNHPVNAEAYLGNPTDNEAEAFLLVNINGVGNYLLNLEEETYREVSSREFVHLPGGVVIVGPISKGQWVTPLPFKNLNEFRVSSRGQLVIVKF